MPIALDLLILPTFILFLPHRCYPSMVYVVIICLSVHLSVKVGNSTKTAKLRTNKQRRTIAQGLYSFLMPCQGNPERGRQSGQTEVG